MARAGDAGPTGFVGRVRELAVIRSVLDRARAGHMGVVLVSGDAGVGKTSVMTKAAEQSAAADPETLVLRGACLPLTSMAVPLLPLRAALRDLPPSLSPPAAVRGVSPEPSAITPVAFDEWLDRTCAARPVILLVDDLQWADHSTLDVLMYVLAGRAHRRLAVLGTVRSGEVGEGHPLQRWLADVRRLPPVREMSLRPMDRGETRDQLGALLGGPPHESLVSEVFSRSAGNAYLTRLLVAGLDPGSRNLGPDLPPDLRAAVLRAWHQLRPAARELVRAIAVGGEVARGPALARAAGLVDLSVEQASPLLREATDAGLLDASAGGGYWFHHPLQAEVLEGSLAPEERRRLHAALARASEAELERAHAEGMTPLAALVAVADHHHRAGHAPQAYEWTMRAVRASEAAAGRSGQLQLIRRAVELRELVTDVADSRQDLLEMLWAAAARHGDHEEELAAVEALLELVVADEQPLLVAELLVRREHLRFSTGRGFFAVTEMRRALKLTEPRPDSWQHAFVLAETAQAGLWHEDPEARGLARRALEAAEGAQHPRALAYACAANAMVAVFDERSDEAAVLAGRAVEAAAHAADGWAFVHASLWECNAKDSPVNPVYARQLQERREQLEELGGAHVYLAWMSAVEAASWLYSGEWEACADRLRVALGSDPGAAADAISRLVAARLAALQGRPGEAVAHLARAEELFVETSTFLAFEFDAVRATVRLARGDPEGAVRAATTGATTEGVPPTMCEWLLPLAARGLADQAQAARDADRSPADPLRRLDELVRRFPHTIHDLASETPCYGRVVNGLDLLYAAEVARAHRAADAGDRWLRAASVLHDVLPWEESYAAWRAGEALLVDARGRREEAAATLRHAHALAERLRALPVMRDVESLARAAHIRLDEVTVGGRSATAATGLLPGLTRREGEILDYIVAGRTYGEIARALFLSEKTVSSHVSNMLRKTGAANRVDLARMASGGSVDDDRT